jgi:hypothetical protein
MGGNNAWNMWHVLPDLGKGMIDSGEFSPASLQAAPLLTVAIIPTDLAVAVLGHAHGTQGWHVDSRAEGGVGVGGIAGGGIGMLRLVRLLVHSSPEVR